MAIISILIMLSQDVKLFIIMFLMNVLREGQETIIDPLYPLINACISNYRFNSSFSHLSIEIIALLKLFGIYKMNKRKPL